METQNTNGKMIGYIILGLIVIILIGLSINEITGAYKENEARTNYCKEQGWLGVENFGGYFCYKEIPHQSGVGVETIYSGEIPRSVTE